MEADIAAHRDATLAQPTANAQPARIPAHQPHPDAVPAFIAMALASPVMESQAADAQAACSAVSTDIRIEGCHHGTRVMVSWPVAVAAECSRALQGLQQLAQKRPALRQGALQAYQQVAALNR